MKDSISIVIPAFNEEKSIEDSINVVRSVISKETDNYEIIIVNDGSTDSTGEILDRLSSKNKKLVVFHHRQNKGFGETFYDGIKLAKKQYLTGFPADNDLSVKTFTDIVKNRNPDRIISSYMLSMQERETSRRIISQVFIFVMNLIFGLKLKYYNGYFICPNEYLHNLNLKSKGFTIFAEIKIRLIKKGIGIDEVPFVYKARPFGVSKALAGKNIIQILIFIPTLIKDIYFAK